MFTRDHRSVCYWSMTPGNFALPCANVFLAHRLTPSLHFTEKFKVYFYFFYRTATQLYPKQCLPEVIDQYVTGP